MSDPSNLDPWDFRDGRHLTAVCSAHPLVLEAAVRHGIATGEPVLIEATCNQVNQDGGYTGLTPAAFRAQVEQLATTCGLAPGHLLLGGDHLGPNPWTALPAEAAMRRAETLVDAYVAAGFTKLHLDTSMPCADDPPALTEATIATRAARLAGIAEATASRHGTALPRYVIGTEVPPPGGAREQIEQLTPTAPAAAAATIALHRDAFAAAGLGAAMQRVIALVVQPGVEFGVDNVVDYAPADPWPLKQVLASNSPLVFEAHSTDYQRPSALAELIRHGFAILKVGPALTFALRETLYRLDALAAELCPDPTATPLSEVMERLMLTSPKQWEAHYHGDPARRRLLRHSSYSDRIRYYWPQPAADQAVSRLLSRLAGSAIPAPLIGRFLPALAERISAGLVAPEPRAILVAAVTDVLEDYRG